MSLKYKFHELQQPNSAPTPGNEPAQPETQEDIERYTIPANVRTLHLIETNGKQTFLNYSYLISGEYLPEENTITLTFTTHAVTLNGNNLESLFEALMVCVIKKISCIDDRYTATKEANEIFISSIIITKIN